MWGDVILLLWPHGVDTISELLSLSEIRQLALHPNEICVWGVCYSSHDCALSTTLVSVVALTSSWGIPVEVDVDTSQTLGNGASLAVALSLCLLVELLDELCLVDVHASVDRVSDSLVKELEACLGSPGILNSLKSRTVLASLLSCVHEIVQWLKRWVCRSENVRVIAVVDGRGDESRGFGIGSGNSKKIDAHDICLSTDGHESVDVLADWDENFASHVSTLLGTWHLILNVNTSCTLLNEELGELHHSSQTAVSSVSISDNWSKEVGVGKLRTLTWRSAEAFLALLAVVEELGHEEVVHLVRDSGVWVICKIWTWLIGAGGSARGLPSRDVDSVDVLSHLCHHDWVETSICC